MGYGKLASANINNLVQLWKQMGAKPCNIDGVDVCQMSLSWPHRCWFEPELHVDELSSITRSFEQITGEYIVPVWGAPAATPGTLEQRLKYAGFDVRFDQTAMCLALENYPLSGQSGLGLLAVDTEQGADTWTEITARSFAYEIDKAVIRKAFLNPDVQLFIAYAGNCPAATVLLFRTHDVMGVHQLGVLPEYRGQGVARQLMQDVIQRCMQMPLSYLTLQASAAGEPLYISLGFRQQFKIRNYQRTISVNRP